MTERRRVYLMRHAAVSYFDDGHPVRPHEASLTAQGREQAQAAADALADVAFDGVVTSGLPRTLETAAIVAPTAVEPASWPELRELETGRLADIPEDELEATFVGAFRGVVAKEQRFLGGETIGSLLDRVVPALERLLADDAWDTLLAVLHGGVNRAILSYALTGERTFLGGFEQAPACINVLDVDTSASGARWVVRAVNVAPYDPVHLRGRATTMEELWAEFRNTQSTTPSST